MLFLVQLFPATLPKPAPGSRPNRRPLCHLCTYRPLRCPHIHTRIFSRVFYFMPQHTHTGVWCPFPTTTQLHTGAPPCLVQGPWFFQAGFAPNVNPYTTWLRQTFPSLLPIAYVSAAAPRPSGLGSLSSLPLGLPPGCLLPPPSPPPPTPRPPFTRTFFSVTPTASAILRVTTYSISL